MIKQVFTIAILLVFVLTTNAQKETVLTVGGEQVSLEEFENIFKKNNRDEKVTKESLDEYIELFVNFKLKVLEAKAQEKHETKAFKKELANYRKQLARPYLTDSEMLDDLVVQAYDRKKTEVNSSHILISCKENASPEDTLIAYNKALKIRARIVGGEDFETVARETSEDPSVKQNGGELGYFSAFQMVYPFENAAYSTNVGEVSTVARTRYGYHLVYVKDKREARGELKVAHLMIKVKNPKDDSPEKTKVDEIYTKLVAGQEFSDLALRYSDDISTKKNGGELPWFGAGKMIEEFENQAFDLEKDGDYSKPFRTEYGWFIVKRLDYRPVATFDEIKKELKTKVSRDSRSELTKSSFVEKLKEEYNFKLNSKSIKSLRAEVDSMFYRGEINVDSKLRVKELFELEGKSYTVAAFISHLSKKPSKAKNQDVKVMFDTKMDSYIEQSILDLEDTKLEGKHTAFRLLMNEYRDGILLFELTDELVWSKAVKDTTGLNAFYEANKNDFKQAERADVVIYSCNTNKLAKQVKSMLEKNTSSDDIVAMINKESSLNVNVAKGLFTAEEREVLSKVKMKEGITDIVSMDGLAVVMNIKSVLPARIKPLNETRGLVTADYQNELETNWIEELRKKYPFSVDNKVLYSLID